MLKSPWFSIAQDLSELARQAGWSRTIEFTQALVAVERKPAVAVVRMLDADVGLIEAWLKQAGERVTLEDSQGGSTSIAGEMAERMLVVFPCGGLPSSSVLNELRIGPHSRPLGTTGIVLTGAERIRSAEDLRVVETTARRWLLPPREEGAASPEDLAAAGAYLWTTEPIADTELSTRVARDMSALRAWLSSPAPSTEASSGLDQHRVTAALKLAGEELDDQESANTGALDRRATTTSAYRTHEELAELRDRVFARLRSELQAVETGIRVAGEGLEADLLSGLPAFVDAHLGELSDPARSGPQFEHYCHEVLDHWRAQPQSAAEQWQRSLTEIDWQVRNFSAWGLVNEGLGRSEYPDRLVTLLAKATLDFPAVDLAQGVTSVESQGAGGRRLTSAFVAALLGAGAGVLTGLGAPAMIAGLGFGALAGTWYGRNLDRSERRGLIEEATRQEIARVARQARTTLTELVDRRSHELREALAGCFAEAAAALDKLIQQSPASARSSPSEYRERLRALSARLLA